ncbi:GntR family transcriptional regulator [Actibacterium mucosum KCTC 23349]|uniref:GntR family transcriptional regulator n=1 Tax=Actibacterium mucosum KCTC 23349 TaxID=1454373 RepID=A0A037ZNN9_9RHOB|nr:GntR family transcriptional regulator [Actibacterium mucosum]KAJ56426.1 GntR family transcriptional regulator [Actibacterium mucosum KCTC 23349]
MTDKTYTALPKYVQLSEMLVREINAGLLLDGERLPPERDMAKSLGTSVGTLRKALADLTEKGMLERRHGSGNYVRAAADQSSVYAFFRLELVTGGGLPTAEVLQVDRVAKEPEMPDFGPSDQAHRIRRLRYLNDVPVALEEIWLDGSHAKRLKLEELSDSLYLYYKSQLNLWITRTEDRVFVAETPGWAPDGFGPSEGQTVGYVERMSWSQDGAAAEFSRNWFDPAVARFVSRSA